MNEHERAAVAHEFMNRRPPGPHQAIWPKRIVACSVQADGEEAFVLSLFPDRFSVTGIYMVTSLPLQGVFLSDSATVNGHQR